MKRVTTKDFIERAKQVHGNKYDYSKVEYIKVTKEVCIICPIHGEFWQKPVKHLIGHGCKECSKSKISEAVSLTFDEFVKRAIEIHGNKYDYSKVDLKHRDEKGRVCIICPIHGEFWQLPYVHLGGGGCKKCGIEKRSNTQRKTTEQFIIQARKVHGDKYNYSKVKYIGATKEVCIICPIHGEFWQTPDNHLHGHGCRECLFEQMRESRRFTTEDFIKRAKQVHGDKYDYSKVKYEGCDKNVIIP